MTQVYAFALDAGLSMLPVGIFAAFKYVRTYFYDKAIAILLRPVSVVFFTHVSEALARGAKDVRDLAKTALARALGVTMVGAVAIVVSARPLLAGMWGFGGAELDAATVLIVLHFLLLFASAAEQVARKTTMSLGLVNRQYLSASVVQAASAAAAWWLIPRLALGG